MNTPVPRRSFLAGGVAAGAVGFLAASPDEVGPLHLATRPEWGLRPGSGEDQSGRLQKLIDTVSARGGGTILLPRKHERVGGSYLVQDIRPRDNVLIEGLHGATLKLPPDSGANLIDNHGAENLTRFVIRGLILDGSGTGQSLVRIKRHGSSGYAWDRGGLYDVELRHAAVGAEVDWAGQVYYRGGRIEDCTVGLRLTREHLYLQDLTFWNCRTGVFADMLLHTHWDHLIFGHGGADSTAVRTPDRGGPHIQESRLVNCEVIDYRRGLDLRYLLDTQISGWRFKSIDYEALRAEFSGVTELSSCRFLGCAADDSARYSAVRIANSTGHVGWRIHNNVARDPQDMPTMRHGFDLSGLADAADAVIGHGNHVRGAAKTGYLKRPNHRMLSPDHNIGSFATT